jgi:hypothetical protein
VARARPLPASSKGLEQGAGSSWEGHSIRVGARGDILLALRQVIAVTDISVVHPLSINTLSAAAAEAGAAASCRDQQKRYAYVRVDPSGYAFVPFSVESYSCLGKPAMKLLHDVGEEAAGPRGGMRASFVLGALCELSIGLIRGNYLMCRVVLDPIGARAHVTGQTFRTCRRGG